MAEPSKKRDPRLDALIDSKPPIDTSTPVLAPNEVQPQVSLSDPGPPGSPPSAPSQSPPPAPMAPLEQPPTPPAPGPSLEEFQAAQMEARKNVDLAHQIARARRVTMMGLGKDPEQVDEGRILQGLNGPLQELVQRQQYAKEQQGMQHQAAQTSELGAQMQERGQKALQLREQMTPGSATNMAEGQSWNQVVDALAPEKQDLKMDPSQWVTSRHKDQRYALLKDYLDRLEKGKEHEDSTRMLNAWHQGQVGVGQERNRVAEEKVQTTSAGGAGAMKGVPPAQAITAGAPTNSGRMLKELATMHEEALSNPRLIPEYNGLVQTYSGPIAAGIQKTGVSRQAMQKEIEDNLSEGLKSQLTGALAGHNAVRERLNGYAKEAESRSRSNIGSIDPSRYDTGTLEHNHKEVFGTDVRGGEQQKAQPATGAPSGLILIRLKNGEQRAFTPDHAEAVIKRGLGVAVAGPQ